jgi:DNA-binding beta-propeller fold protein YncE
MTKWIAPKWVAPEWVALVLLICATSAAQEAPIPSADELAGTPFTVKNKWVIGGVGQWDYMAFDPTARQLFITRQTTVQVVDAEAGTLAGQVSGFEEARDVALDPNGDVAYVSDGRADVIRVFDRRSFQILASISIQCSPRSVAFEPQTRLLFVACGAGIAAPAKPPSRPRSTANPASPQQTAPATPQAPPSKSLSHVVVIDADQRIVLANITASGDFRHVQSDEDGQVYITVGAGEMVYPNGSHSSVPPRIAHLDAGAISVEAHRDFEAANKTSAETAAPAPPAPVTWDADAGGSNRHMRFLPLAQSCPNPQGIAVDGRQRRLFVACDNQTMLAMNSTSGEVLASLTTGPGVDAIAYDQGRGLIFTANGGGYGSITVIRRHVTDTYSVIQNLPTLPQARTIAIDPSTGLVYLVSMLYGANLENPPANGIGTLKLDPVNGSFQVLVIGN